jgi:hypothetical protein
MDTTTMKIDFLFLDLETCNRCRGTDRRLGEALGLVRAQVASNGADVELNRIHVATRDLARALRFRSSPTIRVNGRDIALELRESSCGSEACTDGCGDSIACRVWLHEGEEHTEPPLAMVADAILGAARGEVAATGGDDEDYELPENLERFFLGKSLAVEDAAGERVRDACCTPTEQESCCEPEDKAECCGASPGETCGCR